MDLIHIAQQLYQTSQKLDLMPHEIYKRANQYAEAERDYRKALAMEEYKLRSEGLPATLIPDIARGNIADLKYERDKAEGLHRGAIESKRALEAQLSALQSLNKNHTEVGG